MKQKRIAGCVVFYNPSNDVGEHITTYLNQIEHLYVIDNSEERDNTLKLPKSKKIEYINNHHNLGIAKALNIACEKAVEDGFDFILTMDQDSVFEGDNLNQLISYVNNNPMDNIGIVSPYQQIVTLEQVPKLEVEHILEVMTSGNLVNLEAYKAVGGFKDWLFIDCVDMEFCMNLRVHSYDIIRLNHIFLKHALGNSVVHHFLWKSVVCSNHNYIRRYYITRNLLYLNQMYFDYFPAYCSYLVGGIKYQMRNIILFEKDKFRKLKSIRRGKRDFKRGIKGEYPYSN